MTFRSGRLKFRAVDLTGALYAALIAAFALAMGVQPVEPRLYELPYLNQAGQKWTRGSVTKNVGNGTATGVLKQYVAPPKDDGHFVIFDLWAARHDWTRFLASHAQTGIATLE